ncbi:hypothetical protein ACFX11_013714 [Malus domestica]
MLVPVSRPNMRQTQQFSALFRALLLPRSGLPTPRSTCGSAKKTLMQQQQLQGSKAGVEVSQTFAMSFASLNSATAAPGIDLTSMNHAFLHSLPDVARHNYQYMAAQAAQQKENYRVPEEKKTGGGDSSNVEEERKAMTGKTSSTVGHSIAFSRPDVTDTSGSTIPGNIVIDSSAKAVNLTSTRVRSSSSAMPAAVIPANAPTTFSSASSSWLHLAEYQYINIYIYIFKRSHTHYTMLHTFRIMLLSATMWRVAPIFSNKELWPP